MAGQILTLSQSDGVAVAAPSAFNGVNSVASANYTVTDTDGYSHIHVTTGASTRTVTLPTAADNAGRRLCIKKVDSGAGKVTVDGESSETIDGYTSVDIALQNDAVDIVCNGTGWYYAGPHYQSFADTTTVPTGAGTSPSTGGVYAVRIGNVVTVRVAGATGTGSPTGIVTWSAILPAWARPATTVDNIVSLSASGDYLFLMEINSSGTIYIARYNDTTELAAANFPTSTNIGSSNVSYVFGV